MRQFCISVLLMSLCAIGFTQAARADEAVGAFQAAAQPVVAVAPFSGDDAATGRFLSDALLTDLAQSRDIRLVERSEIQRARTELGPERSRRDEYEQFRTLGRMVQADRVIVGSFLIRDKQIVVNARLVDVKTGRLIEGAGANVAGDTGSLLPLVHRLAHLLHRKITGRDLSIDGEGAEKSDVPGQPAPRRPDLRDNSQPIHYRVTEPRSAAGSDSRPRVSEPARVPNSYRTSEFASVPTSPDIYVAPQTVIPIAVPYYQPIYYGYPFYYNVPFFSFSYVTGSRSPFFPSRSFGHFGGGRRR